MTREEILDGLYLIKNWKCNGDAKMHEVVTEAIKALEQTRWIPVSERLPEKNMACLLSVGIFHFTMMGTYSDLMGTTSHKIFWIGEYGKNDFKDVTEYVKAWMPLPEPYNAESEVGE